MADDKITLQTKTELKIDFDSLPLEGFETGRKSVQKCFDQDFAKLPRVEQHKLEKLLSKKTFSKEETVTIRNYF